MCKTRGKGQGKYTAHRVEPRTEPMALVLLQLWLMSAKAEAGASYNM